MKLLYEADKWTKVASALEKVNEAHKYDNKYEKSDDLFKDSKAEISEKDIDHAISFKPKTYEPGAKPIRQDYKKLYDYAKGIGKVIDEKVDDPFYKSIDGYIQSMADLNISSYNTTNTIHVEEGWLFKTDKASITIDDLYEADTTYSENLKEEYNQWKLQNKDQEDVSEEDYRTAALNTGAFEYEGLRAGQEKKEFWFNLIAAGLVIGLTIVCPPAGLVAGGIYTAVDVGGAIKGEDLISGRKLSDDERIMRGVFAIAPAAGGLAIRTTLKNVPALANVVVKTSKALDKAAKPIKNSVDNLALKTKQTAANAIRNANHLGRQHANQLKYMLKHPVNAAVASKAGETTIKKSAKFIDEALRPVHIKTVQTTTGEKVVAGLQRGENTGEVSKKADDYVARIKEEKDKHSYKPFDNFMDEEDAKRYNQFWEKTEIGMSTNERVATNKQSPNSFVNSILPKKLKEHNLSYEEFTNLRLKPDYQYSKIEQKIMQDIRDSVVRPDTKTILIKNIHANDIQKYLDGSYEPTVRGFIAKAEDSAHIHDYKNVRESMRLDYSYYDNYKNQVIRPYPEEGSVYGYIEFKAYNIESLSPELLEIPYGKGMSMPYSEWENNEWPWSGNGFTSSRNGEVIPEWATNNPIEMVEGAKLHRVTNGKDEVIAIFDGEIFE